QRRGREDAGHSPRIDHPPAARRQGAARGRGAPRNDPIVDRTGNARRHYLGHRSGTRMNARRYPSLPWPWIGLLLCVALLAQEHLFQGAGLNAPLTVYRLAVMTIGVTSAALVLLPRRRIAYVLAFAVCAGLMGYALYLQYVVGLEPCPLCVFQRLAIIAMGVVFLIAAFHNPGRTGATAYALAQLLIGGTGAALAIRQVWLQSLPKDQVPACGMGLKIGRASCRERVVVWEGGG